MANFIASKNRQYLTCHLSAIGRNRQKSLLLQQTHLAIFADTSNSQSSKTLHFTVIINRLIYIGKNLPGINLFIILFLRLTSSDPGTQSSSLSSLLSFELSPSWPKYSVLLFFTGVLRGRPWSPAGTTGTGSPENEERLVNMQNE